MQQHQTVFPIIVPLGFAGSRHLLPAKTDFTAAQRTSFFNAVEAHLTEVIQHLPGQLGMSDQHVFCGISQIAIGADAIFTRVCANLNVPQRIFLPQTRDVYLAYAEDSEKYTIQMLEKSSEQARDRKVRGEVEDKLKVNAPQDVAEHQPLAAGKQKQVT